MYCSSPVPFVWLTLSPLVPLFRFGYLLDTLPGTGLAIDRLSAALLLFPSSR